MEWTTRNIGFERERNLAKIYLEAFQDFNQQKMKFMDSKQWKKGRKTRKRGDGEKICGQGSMSKDNGRTMEFLVVGHPFNRVDAW